MHAIKEGRPHAKEGRKEGHMPRKDIKTDHRVYYHTVHFAGEQNTSATKWSTRGAHLEGRKDGRKGRTEGRKERGLSRKEGSEQ